MLQKVLLCTALVGAVCGQGRSSGPVTYASMDPCRQGGCASTIFDKGYFFQVNSVSAPPTGYALWGPDGNFRYQTSVLAPDGTSAHLRDWAIDEDGTVIVTMSYGGYGGNGHVKGGGIVMLSPSGMQTQFIDTSRWLPAFASFGPDHSIWVTGTQFAPLREGDPRDHISSADYRMLRKYSRDGKLLGEFAPRSWYPAGLEPFDSGLPWVRAATDRIAVLAHPGKTANQPELVEFDLDGKLIGRWKLGPEIIGDPDTRNATYILGQLVFTSDGRLFAQPYDGTKPHHLAVFDRATSSWMKIAMPKNIPSRSSLVGAMGDALAFENRTENVELFLTPVGSIGPIGSR